MPRQFVALVGSNDSSSFHPSTRTRQRGRCCVPGGWTIITVLLMLTTMTLMMCHRVMTVSALPTVLPSYHRLVAIRSLSVAGVITPRLPLQPLHNPTRFNTPPGHQLGYSTTSTMLHARKEPSSTNGGSPQPSSLSSDTTVNHITTNTNDSLSTTPSSSSSNSKPRSSQTTMSRKLRQGFGALFSATGFVVSSTYAIIRNPRGFRNQTKEPLLAFYNYLQSSGIYHELGSSLTSRSLPLSLTLLRRVHDVIHSRTTTATTVSQATTTLQELVDVDGPSGRVWTDPQLLQRNLQRYMRFATAVYGPAMIRAAQVDAWNGSLVDVAGGLGRDTMTMVSQHMNVPVEDIVVVQVDDDYTPPGQDQLQQQQQQHRQAEEKLTTGESLPPKHQPQHILRHLVAIDHKHRQVVLVIRGTFSLQEVVVDIVSFAREDFCGVGQAHEGMASMAEGVWKAAGATILETLQAHPNYELVVVGHSLGAGTACLLTIMLQETQGLLPPGTGLQCVAFASPPIFATTKPEQPSQSAGIYPITHVIHEHDAVPLLSVYSVRHLLASLQAIRATAKELPWSNKWAIMAGSEPPPSSLLQCVPDETTMTPKQGAPKLYVPAQQTLWLRQCPHSPDGNDDTSESCYQLHQYSPTTTSHTLHMPWQIKVHPNMLTDHLPPRYEYALQHLKM